MSKEVFEKMQDIIVEAGPGKIKEVEDKLYSSGALKPEDLSHGDYYIGVGSHSFIGVWSKESNSFAQIQFKDGAPFAMPCNHFSNFDGTGFFVPIRSAIE